MPMGALNADPIVFVIIIKIQKWRLVQVQVSWDPGMFQCGTPSLSAPPGVLEVAYNGGKGGRLLRAAFKRDQGVT